MGEKTTKRKRLSEQIGEPFLCITKAMQAAVIKYERELRGLKRRVLDHIFLNTYGKPGSPKSAPFPLRQLAAELRTSQGRLSEALAFLLEAKVLKAYPATSPVARRDLGVQKKVELWAIDDARARERARDADRQRRRATRGRQHELWGADVENRPLPDAGSSGMREVALPASGKLNFSHPGSATDRKSEPVPSCVQPETGETSETTTAAADEDHVAPADPPAVEAAAAALSKITTRTNGAPLAPEDVRPLARESVETFGLEGGPRFAAHVAAECLAPEREVDSPRSWIGSALRDRRARPAARKKRAATAPNAPPAPDAEAARRARIETVARRLFPDGQHVRITCGKPGGVVRRVEWSCAGGTAYSGPPSAESAFPFVALLEAALHGVADDLVEVELPRRVERVPAPPPPAARAGGAVALGSADALLAEAFGRGGTR